MAWWNFWKKPEIRCGFCQKVVRPGERHACARKSVDSGPARSKVYCRQCKTAVYSGDRHSCATSGENFRVPSREQIDDTSSNLGLFWATQNIAADSSLRAGMHDMQPVPNASSFAPTEPICTHIHDAPDEEDRRSRHSVKEEVSVCLAPDTVESTDDDASRRSTIDMSPNDSSSSYDSGGMSASSD